MSNLKDVTLTAPINSGDFLSYDTTISSWVNTPAMTLAKLKDVSLKSNLLNADQLVYDATNNCWSNQPLPIATTGSLGNVIIGSGLIIDPAGILSIPGRIFDAYTTPIIPPNNSYTFSMVLGGTITLMELSVSSSYIQVEAFSTVDMNDTNPYTFISSSSKLMDDGSSVMSDGSIQYGRRYTLLSNLESPAKNIIYWKITNLDNVDQAVTLNLLYLVMEVIPPPPTTTPVPTTTVVPTTTTVVPTTTLVPTTTPVPIPTTTTV